MRTRIFFLVVLPLLFTCATAPRPSPPEVKKSPSDDTRLVSREDFRKGDLAWSQASPVTSWTQDGRRVTLALQNGQTASFTFLGPEVFRFWFHPDPQQQPSLTAAMKTELSVVTLKVTETAEDLNVFTGVLLVKVNKKTLQWEVRKGDLLVFRTGKPLEWTKNRITQFLDMKSAPIWSGLGLSGKGLVKNGQSVKFWNDLPDNADETVRVSIPFLLGLGGPVPFALYLDNSYQTYAHLGEDAGYLGTLNGGFDLYFFEAKDPRTLVQNFTALTNRPLWGPRWALGTGVLLGSEKDGSFFRNQKLSVESSFQTEAFRSPYFHAIFSPQDQLEPPSASPLGKEAAEKGYLKKGVLDFSSPEARSWWTQGASLPEIGEGWALGTLLPPTEWKTSFWDSGRNSTLAKMHNLLPQLAAQTAVETLQKLRPAHRPWVTYQAGFTGASGWGTLEIPVKAGSEDSRVLAQVLSASLSGMGSVQILLDLTDLAKPDQTAKVLRSLSLWVLNPYLVLNFGTDPAALWQGLDPVSQKKLRQLLEFHSQLKPTFYQATRLSSQEGTPFLRPLFFDYSSDPQALKIEDEFLAGDSLLAAPVFGSETSRKVYLPGPGVWFDWYTGEEITGGQTVSVPTEKLPLFARAGALVSVRDPELFTGLERNNPLTVHVYPGARGTSLLYQDDGDSLAYQKGVYNETRASFSYFQKEMEIDLESLNSSTEMRNADPYVLFRLHNVYRPKTVMIANRPIPLFGDSFGITDSDRSAAWYENDNTLLIKVFHPEQSQEIDISY